MNYHNPKLHKALAAEYVVGTLRGPARRRFERVLESEPSVRAEVYFWELCFSEMTEAVPPVSPPSEAWTYLRSRMPAARPAMATQAPRRALWAKSRRAASATRLRRRSLRILVGMATAATLVLGIRFAQSPTWPVEPESRSFGTEAALASTEQPEPAPMFVTLLRVPTSNLQWLVSLSPDQRQINVVAAGDYPRLGQRKMLLWLISPNSDEAVPLGELPNRSGASVDIKVPRALYRHANSGFELAVSLEPEESTPHDLPDGPIVTWARNLTTQRDNGI